MEQTVNFTKMHGLGNDYIYIETIKDNYQIDKEKNIQEVVRYLSDRHFGIGGDGVIFIEKSKNADFKMRMFNSDGSEAEMCGNGIRCFAKYVYDEGFTQKEIIKIETLAGIKEVTFIKDKQNRIEKVKVNMGIPKIEEKKQIFLFDEKMEINVISMGNPHAIIFVDNVEHIDIEKYGAFIENHEIFPQKTNVEFVQILDKNLIKMRVWERGAGETLACGTGACASVVAGVINNLTRRKVKTLLTGGELEIEWEKETNEIYMTGIATKVFEGKIKLDI